ncbi:ABC transporter permease [Burkholderia sp. Ax-1724]|uniref:ABC transporter permease n=1 Tax=Burkholderia sp. Ax-1724 TaxID=2608336 RepID=UPI001420E7CD|nr:ABC transporter permease [Burkholderia sp. Ax-1724]NIF52261.1 ABC transporter permease [Burkholderia sp. Ax-1724]
MGRYLARQTLHLVVTLAGILTVTFFLVRMIPGDPAQYMLGDYATNDALAALREQLGLNHSLLVQYGLFIGHVLHGDLGTSVVTGRPALLEIVQSLPDSAILAVAGMTIAVLVGVPLGIVTAVRHGSFIDIAVMLVALAGISFPVFWLGLAGILVFAQHLKWLPALGSSSDGGFIEALRHLVLPAAVLGVSVAAYIARLTRSAMLEVIGHDYIRVARAMGVRESTIVWRLAFRNALVPVLSIIGVTFSYSLGSAILIEVVFSRPGIGTTILKAVSSRDYPLVQAGVLALAVIVVLVNTALDLLYAAVDPRLRTR